MNPDLDIIYPLYIDWRSRPAVAGDPANITEFCATYQITKKDLRSFQERPTYYDDLVESALKWSKGKLPELLQSAYTKAKASANIADLEKFTNIILSLSNKGRGPNAPQPGNTYNFIGVSEEKFNQMVAREASLLPELPSGTMSPLQPRRRAQS